MGTETEYGISVSGQPGFNPIVSSSLLVNAYAPPTGGSRPKRPMWDFEEESPLRDARGFDLGPAVLAPDDLEDDLGLANAVLTNGARLYVDHAHPEYSSPEVTNPLDAVIWDKAGEWVMRQASVLARQIPHPGELLLYKNNTDNKGVSYGSHENYLMARETPFANIVRNLTPFFVTRQLMCGAGRVGIGQDARGHGFQISQRSDFFEVEVGLETTLKRPIINTRDEPHADAEKYRRLHVIIGDANLAEVSIYLKLGTTAIVLAMIEADFIGRDLSIDNPVAALRAISHDPTCTHVITLRDGRKLTGVQLQLEYLELANKFVADRMGTDVDPQTKSVLERWESVLDRLERDPMSLSGELDWVAKYKILLGMQSRDGLEWKDPKLQLIDLQYCDLRTDKGLYQRLAARGAIERLVTDEQIAHAVEYPPEDTRAYFRGECVRRFGASVAAASWDSVVFDLKRDALQRVPTMEPLRGTKAHVGALFEAHADAISFVDALTGKSP